MEKYLKEVARFKKTKSPGALIYLIRYILHEIHKETGWNYLHIVLDFLSKRIKLKINPHEYFLYYLYDEGMPEQYRAKFVSRITRDTFLEKLNPLAYILVARNKYITKILLKSLDIPTPEMIFLYDPQAGLESSYVINNPGSAQKKILEFGNQPFVVKVLEGEHGKSINVYSGLGTTGNQFTALHLNGESHTIEQLLTFAGKNQRLLFEVKVKQTPTFEAINPTSINTIRMLTLLHPSGEVTLIFGLIRIGRKGRWIDNSGKGGNVMARLNKETGKLENIVSFTHYKAYESITHHPDSGIDLEHFEIKNWQEIKQKVFDFHRKLSWLKAIGWDIAITEQGPVIIEINNRWDVLGQTIAREGWHDYLNSLYEEWKQFEDSK
ncbi:MAG: sugar-transfer associated ATP-grasp domain-containing protein [Lentimicrobium sp.]|jgi:hypothetical protein|nr:sugar-transfer associated ATP-grasp domain-containing protein [Lentimicrobium sp.]